KQRQWSLLFGVARSRRRLRFFNADDNATLMQKSPSHLSVDCSVLPSGGLVKLLAMSRKKSAMQKPPSRHRRERKAPDFAGASNARRNQLTARDGTFEIEGQQPRQRLLL